MLYHPCYHFSILILKKVRRFILTILRFFFFISKRTTKIVSNNCLLNEYKDGNTCKGIYILIYSLILKKDEKYMFYSRLFQFNIRILSFNRSFYIKKSGVNIFFLECPAGYFGLNCSQTCVFPSYGINCSEICNIHCLICHHVQGCISLESTGTVLFSIQFSIQ